VVIGQEDHLKVLLVSGYFNKYQDNAQFLSSRPKVEYAMYSATITRRCILTKNPKLFHYYVI